MFVFVNKLLHVPREVLLCGLFQHLLTRIQVVYLLLDRIVSGRLFEINQRWQFQWGLKNLAFVHTVVSADDELVILVSLCQVFELLLEPTVLLC